jgi:LPS-assembly protein
MDATVGAEIFTNRGWAQRAEFRVKPTRDSYAYAAFFGVQDRGDPKTKQNYTGEEVRAGGTAQFDGFRAVGNIDYLSSFAFRIVWAQIFTAVYSEVVSQGFVSKNTNGYSYNLWLQRYQNFLGYQANQVVTIQHLPSLEFSTVDRKLGNSGLFWSFDTAVDGLHRSQPTFGSDAAFSTAPVVGRFDLSPDVSWPWQYHGWSLRPELGLEDTTYSQRQSLSTAWINIPARNPGSTPPRVGASPITVTEAVDAFINRKAAKATVELRPPPMERVFHQPVFGAKLKHVVEPAIIYRKVSGIDNFSDILRFDLRDVLSDTNEVQYGFIQRLYAKRVSPPKDCSTGTSPSTSLPSTGSVTVGLPAGQGEIEPGNGAAVPGQVQLSSPSPTGSANCTNQAREVVTWELAQKYYLDPTFGGALVPGKQNIFATTADFEAISFLTEPRHLSPLISRMHVSPGLGLDVGWDTDYDFFFHRLSYSSMNVGYHLGQFTLSGSDTYLQVPGIIHPTIPDLFHQARGSVYYGSPTKRGLSGASMMGFDIHSGFLQFVAIQSTYNWNCCGITVDFRRFVLGPIRNENQYRFTFNIANIGSFGNLTNRYRMY